MIMTEYIQEVNAVDWRKFDGHKYFDSGNVPKALISLALVEKEEDSNEELVIKYNEKIDLSLNNKICNEVLSAVGNDHSGSYYPVIREALPFIIKVALSGNNEVARNCAINCLIDLYSFAPYDGSQIFNSDLQTFVKTTIEANIELFSELAKEDTRNKKLLTGFVEILSEAIQERAIHDIAR